jgi:hypothetical protein
MTLPKVIKEATARGIQGLPEPSRLTNARVWPAPPRWIAEVGEPPHNESAGDGLYDDQAAAIQATREQINKPRERLVAILPADLAATAAQWPEPTVSVWIG